MMTEYPLLQILSLTADFSLFIFIVYYFLQLRDKEKALEKKESSIDTQYHQIVDDALSRERKILEDATDEANAIIADARNISLSSREKMHQSLQQMVSDIQQEATASSRDFIGKYKGSLEELTTQSTSDFHHAMSELKSDLQQQIKQIHETALPTIEKELAEYKQSRMKETEQMVTRIVQKASQELLNKSLSLDDHQKLLIDSMEKAKREGAFD